MNQAQELTMLLREHGSERTPTEVEELAQKFAKQQRISLDDAYEILIDNYRATEQ